jgi:hypothetical protein
MKSITVFGFEVTSEVQAKLIAKMKQMEVFCLADIEAEAVTHGVPMFRLERGSRVRVATRTADRLLQRERRAGNIKYGRDGWRLTGEEK